MEFLRSPETSESLRFESGVREGDEISIYYDPMIAKVIARGADRQQALRRLDQALSEFHVVGVKTNIPFIRRILNSPKYSGEPIDTGFIADNHAALLASSPVPVELVCLGGIVRMASNVAELGNVPWRGNDGIGCTMGHERKLRLGCEGQQFTCAVTALANDVYLVRPVNS